MDTTLTRNDQHQYHRAGMRLMGFSESLECAGLVYTSFFTDEAAERGRVVHKICELFFKNDLDEKSIDPQLKGYFDAVLAFAETHCTGTGTYYAVEQMLSHPVYRYATTPDLIGKFWTGTTQAGADANGHIDLYVDFKSGVPAWWHALQGAQGCEAWNKQTMQKNVVKGFATCYLHADGTFKLSEITLVGTQQYNAAYRDFLNALAVTQLKFKHGLHK